MDIVVLLSRLTTSELMMLKKIVDFQLENKLSMPDDRIENIEMSVRLYNVLKDLGISTLTQLTKISSAEFLRSRNVGIKSYKEISDILSERGLSWLST